MKILTKLELSPQDDGWIVDEDFVVVIDEKILVIPMGFETDLASTPRFFWPIFPPFGKWTSAAVIHDYLYRVPSRSRREADAALYDGCICLGVTKFRAWIMWAAVRLFGFMSFGGK